MNLSEPASKSWFVKAAHLHASVCTAFPLGMPWWEFAVNPPYPVQTWNSDAVLQGGIFFSRVLNLRCSNL